MNPVLEAIGKIGLVPVIKIDDAAKALPLARALNAGGLPCAEVTFRTEAAADAIAEIARGTPETLVGAGTVINVELARRAVDSGARFVVAPGFNPSVVDFCVERGIPVVPGVNDPSGIEAALERGLDTVKFFPAEASGGVAMLDALAGPFANVTFMPTGGIGPSNLGEYARRKNVLAIGGSWMVPADLVAASDWDAVTALCRDAVLAVQGFSFAHVGINAADPAAAAEAAGLFALLGLAPKEGASSIFCGTPVEVMKAPFRGAMGHIGISCWNLERSLAYLAKFGFASVPETEKREGGRLTVAYLDREIAGFACHLVRAK